MHKDDLLPVTAYPQGTVPIKYIPSEHKCEASIINGKLQKAKDNVTLSPTLKICENLQLTKLLLFNSMGISTFWKSELAGEQDCAV